MPKNGIPDRVPFLESRRRHAPSRHFNLARFPFSMTHRVFVFYFKLAFVVTQFNLT
jgi:hypothetical protein